MSARHPTPWTFSAEDECEDTPILDSNGDWVLVRDSGCYPPDLDTCREIVEAVNALDASPPPQGNDAVMRGALERSTRRLQGVVRELPLEMQKYVNADIRDNVAALSEPPRNCDVGTPQEQIDRFRAWCSRNYNSYYLSRGLGPCDDCPLCEARDANGPCGCALAWAKMPCEEGGAE